MKRTITALVATLMCATAIAQTTDATTAEQPKARKNEIGVTAELDAFNSGLNSTTFQALQFKRWKNEHFGARFLIGRGDFQSTYDFPPYYQVKNDTVYKKTPITFTSMGIAGVGLEAQRQFYKRVYLFAAVEAKFSFGSGRVDTITERSVESPQHPMQHPIPSVPAASPISAQMFYAGLTPTFGAKFQFSRFTFGSEMAWNLLNYTSTTYGVLPTRSMVDLDMSRLSPRFFVHYRF